MPSNILAADINFPQLNGNQTTDQKFKTITDYLYILLEQLRYSMANLGVENFNEAELENIANLITEPVYVQLKDVEDNVSSLSVTAEQLISRMSDAEGNITTLQQTSDSLSSRVSDAEGNITSLQQTATGLYATVSDLSGDVSSLTFDLSGVSLNVMSLTQQMGQTVRIAADGITITNAQGSALEIDGGQIKADTIIANVGIASAKIMGGRFYNTAGAAYLEVGGTTQGDMTLWGSGSNQVFRIYDTVGGISMSSYGVPILEVFSATGDNIYPQSNWDFSGATVTGITASFA